MPEVTDEEVEAAVDAMCLAKGGSMQALARAAILAYLATPGQVKLREDAERWQTHCRALEMFKEAALLDRAARAAEGKS